MHTRQTQTMVGALVALGATTGQRQSEAGWLTEYRARRHAWAVAARQRCQDRGELMGALNRLEQPGMDEADLASAEAAARAIWRRIAELDAEAARAVTI